MQDLRGVIVPGLGVALSPFPIIATVLVLGSARAGRNGVLFVVGWVAALASLTAVLTVVVGAADEEATPASAGGWIRIVAGIALIVLAAQKWRDRPTSDDDIEMPGWMSAIDALEAPGAVRLGAMLGGLNPKNVAFSLAAASIIGGGGGLPAAGLYLAVASSSVLGLVGVFLVAGERATPLLGRIKAFMVRHNTVILVAVLLILGAMVLVEGLAAV